MFKSLEEIKRLNKAKGFHFFSAGAMDFFDSRVEGDQVYRGRYFVTSEQFHASDGTSYPREYSVREAHEDGRIERTGTFSTLQEAIAGVEIKEGAMQTFIVDYDYEGHINRIPFSSYSAAMSQASVVSKLHPDTMVFIIFVTDGVEVGQKEIYNGKSVGYEGDITLKGAYFVEA